MEAPEFSFLGGKRYRFELFEPQRQETNLGHSYPECH